MDGRGDATIAWAHVSAPRSARSIDVVERAPSGRYGPVSVLATDAVSLDGIAVNPAGDAVLVWDSAQGSPTTGGTMATTPERDGPFGLPVPIVSPPIDATGAAVGIDDAGQALIASPGLSSRSVQVTPLQIGATTAGQTQTFQAAGAGTVDPFPLIDVDGAGDAIVAWENTTHDGVTERVVAARRSAGRPFGTPVTIDSSSSRGPDTPSPQEDAFDSAIGPGGEAIVAWDNTTAPVHAVLASSAKKPFGRAVALAPAGEALPAVGIGAHARAITIWWDPQTFRLQYATTR